jgi:hypothetical protein
MLWKQDCQKTFAEITVWEFLSAINSQFLARPTIQPSSKSPRGTMPMRDEVWPWMIVPQRSSTFVHTASRLSGAERRWGPRAADYAWAWSATCHFFRRPLWVDAVQRGKIVMCYHNSPPLPSACGRSWFVWDGAFSPLALGPLGEPPLPKAFRFVLIAVKNAPDSNSLRRLFTALRPFHSLCINFVFCFVWGSPPPSLPPSGCGRSLQLVSLACWPKSASSRLSW